jgi:hypothetical protein
MSTHEYSRSSRKSVYLACKRVFSKFENAQLRRQKAIRSVVDRYHLHVWGFSTDKLVLILQLLLKDEIFGWKAQNAFPELFKDLSPKQNQQTVIQKQPTAGRQASDMGVDDEPYQELLHSLNK